MTYRDDRARKGWGRHDEICSERICRAGWGFLIGPDRAGRARAALGEALAVMISVAAGVLAYAPWLAGDSAFGASLGPQHRIVATILFFAVAMHSYGIARRGLAYEVHVNMLRRRLRLVRRNRAGKIQLMRKLEFDDIRCVHMRRSEGPNPQGRLYALPRGGAPLLLARGPTEQLEPVLAVLISELRAAGSRTGTQAAECRPRRPAPIAHGKHRRRPGTFGRREVSVPSLALARR